MPKHLAHVHSLAKSAGDKHLPSRASSGTFQNASDLGMPCRSNATLPNSPKMQ